MVVLPLSGFADYEYIDIHNPFLRKVPIAVPLFKSASDNQAEAKKGLAAAELLSDTLAFTGYFKILDPEAFLIDPGRSPIITSNTQFDNWTSIGAELLVTGVLLIKDELMEMELRLYDTFKKRLLVGKRYKGWVYDQRQMIRRFCSNIIFFLTGNRGIFNSKIAFVSTGSGWKNIHLCDFDGYNPKPFTDYKSITLFPSWSSDAKWLAYTSFYKGKPDIYIKHIKEKHGAMINRKGINSTPSWVPNKFELAATLSFSGDPEIYLLTGNGKMIKRLTYSRGIDSSPTWSPDGKKMAFVSGRSGSPQIYIKDLTSSVVERLTFEGKYNTQPSWSPQGDKIAYTAMKEGRIDIHVVDLTSKSTVQLTHGSGDDESPSWSPDGSLIVFASTREGPSRIYVMTAYGTDQRRLLTLPGEQTNPKWSPGVINN